MMISATFVWYDVLSGVQVPQKLHHWRLLWTRFRHDLHFGMKNTSKLRHCGEKSWYFATVRPGDKESGAVQKCAHGKMGWLKSIKGRPIRAAAYSPNF